MIADRQLNIVVASLDRNYGPVTDSANMKSVHDTSEPIQG
jgi:hypothetical protein